MTVHMLSFSFPFKKITTFFHNSLNNSHNSYHNNGGSGYGNYSGGRVRSQTHTLTEAIPKPLVPVHGKPILEHTIKQLSKHGVKNIIISVGYKAQQIMECFGDGSRWKLKISYIVELEPLGTGGAVKKAALGLQKPFLLVWGII